MKNKSIRFLLLGALLVLFVSVGFGQKPHPTPVPRKPTPRPQSPPTPQSPPAPATRSITSDDFASQRPAAKKTVNKRLPKVTYKYVRRDNTVSRRKTPQAAAKDKAKAASRTSNKPQKVSEIGITIWKMRPPRPGETGVKLPVQDDNKMRKMWIAERVSLDSIFKAGDRVRLAIESPDSGYLYVIDSEMYSDGSIGEPHLIFPESLNEDNSVKPGMLVDIPDQKEDWPYFLVNPDKRENYIGELLTIVVTPNPLTNLRVDKEGVLKNPEELIDLEADVEAEVYSRNDIKDKVYSATEAESACGAKSRQLKRPCETNSRQLTREDPLPQTIYRVKPAAGQPAVVLVKLNATL